MALCPLYGPLSPLKRAKQAKQPSRNVLQNAFRQNSKDYRDLFRISDNRDYRDNHDYHSSEILGDYRFGEKSCNNRDNHIQQEAIIVFREKMKTPFRINPSLPRTGFCVFYEEDILPFLLRAPNIL
jgi:hypothetical protein